MDSEELISKTMKTSQRPRNMTLILGHDGGDVETTGRTADLNIFSSALRITQMEQITRAGDKDCGASGDLLIWEEAEWTLHAKARIIEVEEALEGPCRRQSKVQVYPLMEYHDQSTCMELCEKLGGRSPSVKTFKDWEYVYKEV